MQSYMRGLIEYHGINNCPYEEVPIFKQDNKEYTFCVPFQKPDIEQIVKVWVNPCILEHKIVKTPKGTSLEGQHITGHKLMVMGELEYKIEYVALEATQTLHTAHTIFPFCGYIVLPENMNPSAYVVANVLIEDIYTEQLDHRCTYNNITMLFIADIC